MICVYVLSIVEKLLLSFPTAVLKTLFSFCKIFLLNPFFQKQWAATKQLKYIFRFSPNIMYYYILPDTTKFGAINVPPHTRK